jgi:hypothetical protein
MVQEFNPLNAELSPICNFLALLGVHHILHVSRIRVKSETFRVFEGISVESFVKESKLKQITWFLFYDAA